MFEATIYFKMTLMDRTSKRFLIFLHAVVIFYFISVLEGIAAKEIVLNDTTPYLMELVKKYTFTTLMNSDSG